MGILNVVGIGPGNKENMTFAAYDAIKEADVIIGYTAYVKLLPEEFKNKDVLSTGMRAEKERCEMALREANSGKKVSLVCSGDSVVYGMAGLIYELSEDYSDVEIKVIPGVSAAISGSALIGAGIGNDFAVISLSDYLTPKETIFKRLVAAAKSDMVIALYNPVSKTRKDSLIEAVDALLEIIDKDTPCAVARNIGREEESYTVTTLIGLKETEADMFSTVFIGNSMSAVVNGKMITRRGYKI